MTTEEIKALNDSHILNTYGERQLALVRGEGMFVWDAEGREYLDCLAGIAVVGLGHCHPEVTEAICTQAKTLVHTSNLYYIEPQVRLAQLLSEHSFANRWFFANCGATANESAIKLVRRYWTQKGTSKPEIIAAEQSFHGRTLATVTATGQLKHHQGFEPLLPGIRHVPYDDASALKKAITPQTGAILLEPIQGEGGVRIPADTYLREVRELCNEHEVLLILDEVQTGMGRTGRLFAYEHSDIEPDVVTLAKALGNGVPISAMGCTEEVSQGLSPGTHASTFGGNPLCTAAALATLDVLLRPGFLERVSALGEYFLQGLRQLAATHPQVVEVRGRGLMIGVEFRHEVKPVLDGMREAGILCGPAGPKVLRFLPPLIIEEHHIDRVLTALDDVLSGLAGCDEMVLDK